MDSHLGFRNIRFVPERQSCRRRHFFRGWIGLRQSLCIAVSSSRCMILLHAYNIVSTVSVSEKCIVVARKRTVTDQMK